MHELLDNESCMHWGLTVGDGWFTLIDNLCGNIQLYIDSHNKSVDAGSQWAAKKGKIPQVVALQVKEKFSGLRFYYSGGDERIQGMMDSAESFSYSICEICGSTNETVGRNKKGWSKTTCDKHVKSTKDFHPNYDESLNEIWKKVREDGLKSSVQSIDEVAKKISLNQSLESGLKSRVNKDRIFKENLAEVAKLRTLKGYNFNENK